MRKNNELQTDLNEYLVSVVTSYEEMMTDNELLLYKMLLKEYTKEDTLEKYTIALKILSRRYAGIRRQWKDLLKRKQEIEQIAFLKGMK